MLHNPFPHAFGLDIGDLSIKVVQLKNKSNRLRGSQYEVCAARSLLLPPGIVVDGELQKPEQMRHYIQKLLKGNNEDQKAIKSPWVVSSVPESQSFIKLLSIPKKPEDIIEDDIMLEAEKHIPLTGEKAYYLDWHILPPQGTDEQETQILLGSTTKQISDAYTYLLESVGLGVIALEIEALSTARAMITADKNYSGEARALLDLGAKHSTIIIYDHDSVRFSASVDFAGELLSRRLAELLNLPYTEAEEIKKQKGLAYEDNKNAWPFLNAEVLKLTVAIKQSLSFYYSHFPNANKITRVTMSGGGSSLKKLPEILSQQLGIECSPGHPWKNLGANKQAPVSEGESLSYANAIGLAIRAADNPYYIRDII